MTNFDLETGANIKSVSPWPTAIKYGVILGIIGIVIALGMQMAGLIDYTGQESNMLSSVINIVISVAIMYFGLKDHKDNDLGGHLTLGRALGFGAIAGLIWGLITLIWTYIFFTYIDPTILPQILEVSREAMEEKGLDEDQLEKALEMSSTFVSPMMMGVMAFFGSVFFGFIYALIIGLFTKTD